MIRQSFIFLCFTLSIISACSNTPLDYGELKINKYRFVKESVPWDTAYQKAEELGGTLACLETREEHDYVYSRMPRGTTAWVGLTDVNREGKWQWINGKSLNPRMLGYLEEGYDINSRDYGHLMRQGGFLSREISGLLPARFSGDRYVSGYLVEFEYEDDGENEKKAIPIPPKTYDLTGFSYGQSDEFLEMKALAESGNVEAQFYFTFMYDNGNEVPQNYKTAVKWYTKAAEQGLAEAQYNLGNMYANGKGVRSSNVKAHMWFNLAAFNGYEDAAEGKDIISKQMTNEQIGRAQDLSEACLAKDYKGC